MSDGFSFSRTIIASSTILPIVGCLAASWSLGQRASWGTQKTFSAAYSSRSSGSACGSALRASYRSPKASEMYLRKISPRATCLYSPASMCPRILSAAAQSFSSNPRFAPLPFFFAFDDFARAMATPK